IHPKEIIIGPSVQIESDDGDEDILYEYTSKLEYEQFAQFAHSFIIDTSDVNIKDLFAKIEWE
ncbi:8868_t:CDS:2, partial [Entrophospora sp. SA101]